MSTASETRYDGNHGITQAGLEFLLECTAIARSAHARGASDVEIVELVDQHIKKQADPAKLVMALEYVKLSIDVAIMPTLAPLALVFALMQLGKKPKEGG